MGFLRKIKKIIIPDRDDRNYWFYVQCDVCQEVLKVRIDLYNHLSIRYGEGKQKATYYCRKVVIGGNRCYRPIEVEITFDSVRKVIDRKIKGGRFVTEQIYRSYKESLGN